MKLDVLIKTGLDELATATVATLATVGGFLAVGVAIVAGVAVMACTDSPP